MSLDLQLQRTIGTAYGEIMKDSGISLPHGRYISTRDFISGLTNNDVGSPKIRTKMVERLRNSVEYGSRDNIWTGVQHVTKDPESKSIYTFNPWKELMEGSAYLGQCFLRDSNNAFVALRSNPREGVSRVRDLYALFTKLPSSLQEEFLGMLKYRPCTLIDTMFRPSMRGQEDKIVKDIVARIINETKPEHRREMRYVLNLMADHNICYGKREIVRGEIETLVGYDVSAIPTIWEPGHLDERVVIGKREELNIFLKWRNPKVSRK